MSDKPKWVEVLEEAERVLRTAEIRTGTERDSLNDLAKTYLAIAQEYQNTNR